MLGGGSMKLFDKSKKLIFKSDPESNIERKLPADVDDDDELADRISDFNRYLAEIAKKFNLNHDDLETMIQMFHNGATIEQISIFASNQHSLHKQANERTCQKIADTINNGRGSYHGYVGKNNPQKAIKTNVDYEIDR